MPDDRDHPAHGEPGAAAEHGGRRLRIGETEPRVLGLPLSWFRTAEPLELRWARHPFRWLSWRREVRRSGPYAPRFEDFRRR